MARLAGWVLSGLVLYTLTGVADAGSPRLLRLVPPGGQRGTTVEVHLAGRYLEKPQEVLLYEPGITVELVEPFVGEVETAGRRERIDPGNRVRIRLNVAPDCALGPHGLRLRTASGLSDYQRFFVGPFATIDEDEPQQPQLRNDRRESAKSIALNSTVHGRMNDPADVDWYRVELAEGQRLSAEIEAARLGVERGLPDLHLAAFDADGKQLLAADDSTLHLQDPLLSLLVPRAGIYYVAVRHTIYNAANDVYRLHIGTFARPTAVYPAGGPAGQELSLNILGDPRGNWTQSVQLPAAPTTSFPFVATDGDVPAPSPNLLRVSPFPNILEAEPNDDADTATQDASTPIALNGIIDRPGDVDYFRFRARKGERLKVHALANAFGSPLDPTITITMVGGRSNAAPLRATDARPNQLGLPPANGMNRDLLDPVLEFTAPDDGEYLLRVEDDRGGGGPDHVYRVELQAEVDAVLTYLPLEPENQFTPQARQAINVAAGNRYNTSVAIVNTNRAYGGDLELVATGLPTGVTMFAPRITASMTRVPVVFEAATDVSPQGGLIEILARPAAGGDAPALASGFRQIIAMNAYGNNDYYLHARLDKLALAVTEPAPFSIEVDEPKSALVQNGEMPLRFAVRRADGFDEPVTVAMEWRPNGVTVATPVLVRPGQSEGEYLIGAARNATAGSYQVTLTCVSGGQRPGYNDNSNRTYVASRPFRLTVAEPHVEARLARTSIERGKTSKLVVRLNHLRPFTGPATATLARLPRGVQLVDAAREITSSDKEVRFTLRATDQALVGNYQGVTLDLTVVEDGQSVRQLVGYGQLRVDAERGAPRAQ